MLHTQPEDDGDLDQWMKSLSPSVVRRLGAQVSLEDLLLFSLSCDLATSRDDSSLLQAPDNWVLWSRSPGFPRTTFLLLSFPFWLLGICLFVTMLLGISEGHTNK